MLDTQEFTGTESYYRFGLTPDVLTDGARYVAEKAGAYWLMDEIVLNLRQLHYSDWFAVATLKVSDGSAVLTIDDGNDNVIFTKDIPYTDFPDPEIKLFAARQDNFWVLMVPSEY